MPKSSKAAERKARTDPAAEALGLRVAELERQIAEERTQAATKVREVDRAMQILRTTMQDLQIEVQRGNDERERLRIENERLHEQLHEARQNLLELSVPRAAEPAPPPPAPPPEPVPDPRVEPLERQLEESRVAATALRQRVAELESTVRQRERDLVAARDAAAELERKLACREFLPPDEPPAPQESATTELRAALDIFSTPPELPATAAPASPARVPEPARPRRPERVRELEFAADVPVRPETSADRPPGSVSDTGESDSMLAIPGIRVERCVEDAPTGLVFDAREIATRRAVTVLILPGIAKLLEGGKLDSLLLARHPNLVAVLAFGVCASGPYLVQERHEGETGDAWVRRIGPLPEPTVLAVALEAARGLRQAASIGAFHGDLTPESVLVDASGRVRILGVGLRSVMHPGDDAPHAPEFASPELRRGTSAPDSRSDVYSLGAVLWFLLTGSPPPSPVAESSGGRPATDAPDVCGAGADVSPETGRLLRRMLAPDPEQRHRTWDQLLIDLEHRQPGVVSPEIRGTLESRARRVIANRPWIVILVLAVPLICAFSVWQASRVSSPEERWAEARSRAEHLAGDGHTEAARQIYRRFLDGVGDDSIESEAARRYEELGPR